MEDLVKVCGVWKKDGDKGTYYTGRMNNQQYFIFQNKNKQHDNHPDFEIYVRKLTKKECEL